MSGDLEPRLDGGWIQTAPLPSIEADRGQLGQLFQNLVGNGLKFRRPGIAPIVRIAARELHCEPGEIPFVEITVEDNGIGFEEKYAERIFQIFQRLHGRGEYEGTGIGLAICRKIVDRHGGRIVAQGRPGLGALFTILLPKIHLQESQTHADRP